MTSVGARAAQANGHYIAIGQVDLKVYTPGTGSGASWTQGSFAVNGTVNRFATGTLFKDLGKTEVSSLRTFRLVTPVQSGQVANPYGGDTSVTFGVSSISGGGAGATGTFTAGYIELGYEGFGTPDPVARFNNL